MKQKRYRIAAVLCVSLVILISLSSIVQSIIISSTTKKSLSQSYATDCTQIANAYSLAVANKISEYMNQMRYYSDSDVVATGNTEQIVEWLRSHTDTRKAYFSSIIYAGTDGEAYSDVGEQLNIQGESFFTQIIKNGKADYVDSPVAKGGSATFHVARSAKRNGETIGVFAAEVSIENIQNMIRYIRFGESAQAWVVAGNGLVIGTAQENKHMKLNMLESSEPSLKVLFQNATNGGMGSGWVKGIENGNERSFVTYTPITNTPWTFALSLSESQIYSTSRQLALVIVVIALITGILVIVVLLMMTHAFLNPLSTVEKIINSIASGNADLTQRITVSSNTEIGSVVDGFNSFTEKLHSMIKEMQGSKEDLSGYGEKLCAMIQENSAFLSETQKNIHEVESEVENQHIKVSSTVDAVDQISQAVESLDKEIKTQTQIIKESSSSITSMIGSIDEVSSSVKQLVTGFDTLQVSVDQGIAGQNSVNTQIQQIEQQSKMLNDANKVISSIASQTNLLAMNAAIEAAHAGEAGQGFAVVADEIRKLSETSSSQSRNIGNQLKGISNLISNVVHASSASDKTFSSIIEKIRETGTLMHEIEVSLQGQANDSKVISTNLSDINGATENVRNASEAVDGARKKIIDDVSDLKQSSDSVKGLVENMETNVHHIEDDDNALLNLSTSINNSIHRIGNQIDQFKV